MHWSRIVLVALMLLDLWYRAHTFGPDVKAWAGVDLWPHTVGESEPLDCDEAAYAYMGHRVIRGDALYRDLTEYKPPLGYWIYTLAVAVGGYNELAIRLLAIPFVLGAIVAVWWIAGKLGGPLAAVLAAGLYVVMSTDPFVFGNGSNMEHFINLFAALSLALMFGGWDRGDRRWFFASGLCLGAAALVKQVALVHAIVFVPALFLRSDTSDSSARRRMIRVSLDLLAFGAGVMAIAAIALSVIVFQGATRSAYEDIVLQAQALATDTLPEPNAPSPLIRWLTGNADPKGALPWPFGSTDYLVWWATGTWPLFLASLPSLIYVGVGGSERARRRLAVGWTLCAWLQVVLPGLYWQHYYLLPTPGVAIVVAVALADTLVAIGRSTTSPSSTSAPANKSRRRRAAALSAALLAAAITWTALLQVRYYLGVSPTELTARYKGGRQWIALRAIGREIARCSTGWKNPHLYVWGWQSPLYLYSGLDSPCRQYFIDNLVRDQADRDHRLIGPRVREIAATLRDRPPELILTGYPPFRLLQAFLSESYLPSRRVLGLWVRRDVYGGFETAFSSTSAR